MSKLPGFAAYCLSAVYASTIAGGRCISSAQSAHTVRNRGAAWLTARCGPAPLLLRSAAQAPGARARMRRAGRGKQRPAAARACAVAASLPDPVHPPSSIYHLASHYLVGRARRYVVVMPRWPAAGLGHLVRVVMLAYKSVDDTLPVCKARPPPPPRARSSRAAAPPGAGLWWGANGGRALGMRRAAARAAPLGPLVRSRARQDVAEQAGSWGACLRRHVKQRIGKGSESRAPGARTPARCSQDALLTGCTAHRMHCSQGACP
jgi:hypothetical protein